VEEKSKKDGGLQNETTSCRGSDFLAEKGKWEGGVEEGATIFVWMKSKKGGYRER
jgi:hypothetical protein